MSQVTHNLPVTFTNQHDQAWQETATCRVEIQHSMLQQLCHSGEGYFGPMQDID